MIKCSKIDLSIEFHPLELFSEIEDSYYVLLSYIKFVS